MFGGLRLPLLAALIHMYAYLRILASWLKEVGLYCKGRVLELDDCSFGRRVDASLSFHHMESMIPFVR